MHLRIYTAVLLIMAVGWAIQLPTAHVSIILTVIGALTAFELGSMCYQSCGIDHYIKSSQLGVACLSSAMAACILLIVQKRWDPLSLSYVSSMLLCWAILAITVSHYTQVEVKLYRWINSLLMTVTVALSGLTFIQMHTHYYPELLTVVVLTALSDSAGYVVGKLFGKKRIFKNISPNKTEFGTLAMLLIPPLIVYNLPSPLCGRYKGVLYMVGLVSLIGDLWMSQLKRSARKKDTGSILPGHGGILDRLDSHILVLATLAIF